ncbi:MAG TPA: hypothetical protein VKX49_01170 [Bryobacteraceae bacterium]|nr:hypothetical protein [Bryobacteraceae bacterium]
MFKSRQLVFSTLLFVLIPPFVLSGATSAVEYIEGSVKSIPANSTGMFNFEDAKQLKFDYGKASYALPYEQITDTETGPGEMHHVLRKIPVPSFSPNHKETLTISYKDASGTAGSLTFSLTARQAAQVRSDIASKKAVIAADADARSNDWWGDRYWKTNRNKQSWDTQTAQSAQPGQSASPATK